MHPHAIRVYNCSLNYGTIMAAALRTNLQLITTSFDAYWGGREAMLRQVRLFDQRYTDPRYVAFKQGVGAGSGLSPDDILLLNGAVTLR